MAMRTVWGTIIMSPDGSIEQKGEGFTVMHQKNGEYIISFSPPFSDIPSIVGSQVLFGDEDQYPVDNVVFPFLTKGAATAITGDAKGNQLDRSFSFIAIGLD